MRASSACSQVVRGLAVVAALSSALVGSIGAAGPAAAADGPPHGQRLSWGPCPPQEAGPSPVQRDPRQQCASLTVPLDYRQPNGPRIRLEVSRIRSGAAHPLALMTGQGGPGFGGLDLPSADETALPAAVTARTDLYGMDYRGIGASSPLDCGVAPEDRTEATGDPYPAADGSIDAVVAWAQRVAADCAEHAGPELSHVDTADIARDVDSVRRALGLRSLSFAGTSYGSYVGAVYASLFPRTSGRVLLNSVVPPGGVRESIANKGGRWPRPFPGSPTGRRPGTPNSASGPRRRRCAPGCSPSRPSSTRTRCRCPAVRRC